jgi:hypothetical protein
MPATNETSVSVIKCAVESLTVALVGIAGKLARRVGPRSRERCFDLGSVTVRRLAISHIRRGSYVDDFLNELSQGFTDKRRHITLHNRNLVDQYLTA